MPSEPAANEESALGASSAAKRSDDEAIAICQGVLWLADNIHAYGTDEWREYFMACANDARVVIFQPEKPSLIGDPNFDPPGGWIGGPPRAKVSR